MGLRPNPNSRAQKILEAYRRSTLQDIAKAKAENQLHGRKRSVNAILCDMISEELGIDRIYVGTILSRYKNRRRNKIRATRRRKALQTTQRFYTNGEKDAVIQLRTRSTSATETINNNQAKPRRGRPLASSYLKSSGAANYRNSVLELLIDFVRECGGINNAKAALDSLSQILKA